MSRARRAGVASVAVAALALTGLVGGVSGAQGATSGKGDPATTERLARAAGFQLGVKHASHPTERIGGRSYPAANPYLAQLRSTRLVDWSYWRRRLAQDGQQTAPSAAAQRGLMSAKVAVPTPYIHEEQEPVGTRGVNDTQPSAEGLDAFGTGRANQAVSVRGALSLPIVTTTGIRTREDQGSIPRATATGIPSKRHGITTRSHIGDGPHGRSRDRHGDFDFYKVRARAGEAIRVSTRGSRIDTVLVVYDARGRIVDANDDLSETSIASALTYSVSTTGDYYVMVVGFSDRGPVPASPFRSGSGSGAGDQGRYSLTLKVSPLDEDFYGVHLDSGDVLGGTLNGRGAHRRGAPHR